MVVVIIKDDSVDFLIDKLERKERIYAISPETLDVMRKEHYENIDVLVFEFLSPVRNPFEQRAILEFARRLEDWGIRVIIVAFPQDLHWLQNLWRCR